MKSKHNDKEVVRVVKHLLYAGIAFADRETTEQAKKFAKKSVSMRFIAIDYD